MIMSRSMVASVIGAALLLIAFPAALRAQDADGRALAERSGGWDSYLRQDGDYNSAVYEAALPSANALTPYSMKVGRPYSDCGRDVVTYYVAPAAEKEINQGNLKGSVKVGEQSFEVTYKLESTGDGVFTILFSGFGPALISAMLEAPSAEISLPNLDDFTASVPLDGFSQAWERAGRMCGNGEGIKLF